ncbi:MAG: hypothetical protein ACFFBC_00290 [Promethearchaeota archaeon]
MNYTEQELQQGLTKLIMVMNTKIRSSTNPNPLDFEFLAHIKTYREKITRNDSQVHKKGTNTQAQLRSFLRKAKPWEKLSTPIKDVSIIKVPTKQPNISALYLVINHMKRELDITTAQTFQRLKGIFNDSRINSLMKEIDQVNKMKIHLNS